MLQKGIKNSGSVWLQFLLLLLLVLLTGILRARMNFSSEMIPGINGGYYPLLVRNLLDYGSIRYPDTPFVYWIQALISLLIRLFSNLDTDQSVLLASRLFDSVFPPLTCIPVFLFARYHLKDQTGSRLYIFLVSSFSVLYLAFLLILTSEMQKNAAGMVWLACFIYSATRISSNHSRKHLLISLLFLILTALTHIGCFAVAFLFILIYSVIYLIRSPKKIRIKTVFVILSILAGIVLLSLIILLRDPDRMQRVLSFYLNPFRLFESPYLFILGSGQQPYFGFLFHNFLLINILSIFGSVLLLLNRSSLTASDFTCALSLFTLSLLLSSPLLGMEWALRYYLMAFLPIAFASVFVFKSLKVRFHRIILSSVFFVITGFSLVVGFTGSRSPAISSDSFADLKTIKTGINIGPNDLVIARHGLEWWTGWVLRCRTGKEYCLRPADWDKYPNIYLLRQLAGNNFPGLQGAGQFAEFPVPETAEVVCTNSSFVLYRLYKPSESEYYPGVLPLLQGEIMLVADNELVIRSEGYKQTIKLDVSTVYVGCISGGLKPGMRADIWGNRIPFSLKIWAERIKAY